MTNYFKNKKYYTDPHREIETDVDIWVRQPEIGLQFDPFREYDAGHDFRLTRYLIDSGTFAKLWEDKPFFVFAPAGGGKTAFRVRLTHACRVNKDRRHIFPIILTAIDPARQFDELLMQAAASELLLHLLYMPQSFLDLDLASQHLICQVIGKHLGEAFSNRLAQIEDLLGLVEKQDNWDLLARSFDPAACALFVPPDLSKTKAVVALMHSLNAGSTTPSAADDRLSEFWTLPRLLGYETIYLLIDGVDAYFEPQQNPDRALDLLGPFLQHTLEWAEQGIFVKYFLPLELQPFLEKNAPQLLTNDTYFDIINWEQDKLHQVIRQRLQAASESLRAVTSLDALCTPALRGVEDDLIRVIRVPLPREIIILVEHIFLEHVHRVGPEGRLEPQDLDAAIHWYKALNFNGTISSS